MKGTLQANAVVTGVLVAGLVLVGVAANSARQESAEVTEYEPNVPALDGELSRFDGFGASIAAIYAGAHQDHRVQGVAMIAPHFIVEDISVSSIAGISTSGVKRSSRRTRCLAAS